MAYKITDPFDYNMDEHLRWYFKLDNAIETPLTGRIHGFTHSKNPFGGGLRYVLLQQWSNKTFRAIVETPLGWVDAIICRDREMRIWASRLISPGKAAQLAEHRDIILYDADNHPIPHEPLYQTHGEVWTSGLPIPGAYQPVGKENVTQQYMKDHMPLEPEVADEVFSTLNDLFPVSQLGENASFGAFIPSVKVGKVEYWLVEIRTNGQVIIPFQWISKRVPWTDPDLLHQLAVKLVPVFGHNDLPVAGRPSFPVTALASEEVRDAFYTALDFFSTTIKEYA